MSRENTKLMVAGRESTFKLPQAGEHMGDIVAWNLRKVLVDQPTLQALADAHGIDHAALPKIPSHVLTFGRVAKRQSIAPKGILVRPIKGTEANVSAFAIVAETYDGAGRRVGHEQVATIEHHADNDSVSFTADNDAGEAVARQIQETYFGERDKATTIDVSQWLADTFKIACRGFQMKESGGLYWVPTAHAGDLRAIKKLVEGMPTDGGRAECNLIPVHDTDEALEAAQRAARDALVEEIKALAEEIDTFDERTHRKTLADRIEAADLLAARADLYHDTLKMMADDLLGQIGGLRGNIDAMLTGRPTKPIRKANSGEPRGRDSRLPAAGTVLTAKYKGKTIEAVEGADGKFTAKIDGQMAMDGTVPMTFRTLSGVGQFACEHAVNGYVLFGLAKAEDAATKTDDEQPEPQDAQDAGDEAETAPVDAAEAPEAEEEPEPQEEPKAAFTPAEMTAFGRTILLAVSDCGGSAKAKQIASAFGKSTVNVLNSIPRLVAAGLVTLDGNGDAATITMTTLGHENVNAINAAE
jgi:hypothetical protein